MYTSKHIIKHLVSRSSSSSSSSRGKLGNSHATSYLLTRLAEGEQRGIRVPEGHESIALAPAGGAVADNGGLLYLTIVREEYAKRVGGGLQTKATNEQLATGWIAIRDGANGVEDGAGAGADGGGDDVKELIAREGID